MRTGALGMIETPGLLGAVEAADSALKCAAVELIGVRRVGGGLVTVLLNGDVAAVKASVDSAAASLSRLGVDCAVHVIPRPDPEAWEMISRSSGYEGFCTARPKAEEREVPAPDPKPEAPVQEREDSVTSGEEETPSAEENAPAESAADSVSEVSGGESGASGRAFSVEESLRQLTVMQLRRLARSVSLSTLTRRQIRDANKEVLLSRLTAFIEKASAEGRRKILEKVEQALKRKRGDDA